MNNPSEVTSQHDTNSLDVRALVNQWLEGGKIRDGQKLLALLHPDIRLTVPFKTDVIWGSINTLSTFKAFDEVVSNFTYKNVLIDGKVAALRFEGNINGELLQGVDLFHFNHEGQIEKIEIMARPLASVQSLQEAIEGNDVQQTM